MGYDSGSSAQIDLRWSDVGVGNIDGMRHGHTHDLKLRELLLVVECPHVCEVQHGW